MRKVLSFLLLLAIGLSCAQQSQLHLNQVNQIIEDVREDHAPDRRTSIFDVNAKIEDGKVVLNGAASSQDAVGVLVKKIDSLQIREVSNNVLMLPDSSLDNETYAVVRLSTAQIRRDPEIESEMISQGMMGSEIRLLRKGPGRNSWWHQCRMEDQYIGWIMRSSFVAGDNEFIEKWRKKSKVVVIENYSRVFESMDDQSCQVSDLVCGNKMIFLGKDADWVHVELPDGRQGYVKANHVITEDEFNNRPPATPVQIVKTAKAFNGIPYFWGGTSIKGFDCSGFTQTVYRLNGTMLPRDANMQVNIGTPISLENNFSELRAGDLLFWGPNENRITHVGIYIGELKFIHADGFVHINSLNPTDEDYSDYRRRTIRAARRILTD
ncbi:C40 family peptidase [candidate division KSB1 bacterium]|nr:C40 family peptidase [candidate division KSB1 bacterium]